MEKEYLNINEVTECLGIKKSTLYFHVENGTIPHYRIGRLIRFKRQDIDQWMAGNKKEKINLSKMAARMLGKVPHQILDVPSIVKKTIAESK
jgi:excisionase family DNA binding protein